LVQTFNLVQTYRADEWSACDTHIDSIGRAGRGGVDIHNIGHRHRLRRYSDRPAAERQHDQGISVQVTYNGNTITVPVEDKCPTCDSTHIDLSEPAFAELAPPADGNVSGITWEFVNS
jgi:hypothetical protein